MYAHVTDHSSSSQPRDLKTMTANENVDVELLKSRIDEQGNLVRKLKSDPSRKVCDEFDSKEISVF